MSMKYLLIWDSMVGGQGLSNLFEQILWALLFLLSIVCGQNMFLRYISMLSFLALLHPELLDYSVRSTTTLNTTILCFLTLFTRSFHS